MGCALTLERDDGQLPPEDVKDLLGRLGANARKLHRMLTNLLDLDRIARGIVQPNRDHVDLTSLARGVLDEAIVDTHRVELAARGPVLANVDAAQVERILENLVTNAVRYTAPGTVIRVDVVDGEEGVTLLVEDTGPGIPTELRESIFEPFRQGSTSPSHNPGVGIGLSLVARFAELHGGRAWVDEAPGGGASFKVFLPHVASNGEASDQSENAPGSLYPDGELDPGPLPAARSARESAPATR
jgi:signal transduction histidine kinase